MATEQSESPPRTPGVVQIVRRSRAGDSTPTSDFLISFGDKTGSAETFSLGRAFSLGDLSRLLTKMGISNDVTDRAVHAMTRGQFREKGDPHTIVFDTLVERLGDVRSRTWERAAKDSWLSKVMNA